MAKMGGGMGGGAPAASPRPMANPRLGNQDTSPRPMPNPRLNPGAGQEAKPQGGGLFPNMPLQKRFDMAMELLKTGMQSAAGSNNPTLAFLAPLAGAAIGGGIENKRAKMVGEQEDELFASMLPGAPQEEIQRLSEIVSNPDTPDYLKAVAKTKLDGLMKPYMQPAATGGGGGGGARKGGGGGSRKSGGGGGKATGGKGKVKLYGEYEIDGILHGRDPYGQMVPYTDPSGKPMKAGGKKPSVAAVDPTAPVVIDGYTIEEIE